jgi:hypothetical protein
MKVVCIDKRYSIGGMSFHVSEINIGQTYELYKEDYVDSYHYTILVDGIIRTLSKDLFVTEQEYRRLKINEILK